MARKTFKTIEADVDAGTHDDRLYNKAFEGFRASLRSTLIPLVRHETPILASMQVKQPIGSVCLSCQYSSTLRNQSARPAWIGILSGQPIWALIRFS